jgi:hypothetical protein
VSLLGEKRRGTRLAQAQGVAEYRSQAIVLIDFGRLTALPGKAARKRECLQQGEPNLRLLEDPVEILARHAAIVADASVMICAEIEKRM